MIPLFGSPLRATVPLPKPPTHLPGDIDRIEDKQRDPTVLTMMELEAVNRRHEEICAKREKIACWFGAVWAAVWALAIWVWAFYGPDLSPPATWSGFWLTLLFGFLCIVAVLIVTFVPGLAVSDFLLRERGNGLYERAVREVCPWILVSRKAHKRCGAARLDG